jgi:hypothetical protein
MEKAVKFWKSHFLKRNMRKLQIYIDKLNNVSQSNIKRHYNKRSADSSVIKMSDSKGKETLDNFFQVPRRFSLKVNLIFFTIPQKIRKKLKPEYNVTNQIEPLLLQNSFIDNRIKLYKTF